MCQGNCCIIYDPKFPADPWTVYLGRHRSTKWVFKTLADALRYCRACNWRIVYHD